MFYDAVIDRFYSYYSETPFDSLNLKLDSIISTYPSKSLTARPQPEFSALFVLVIIT